MKQLRHIAAALIERALAAGADDADAVVVRDRSRSICVRQGATESITQDDGCTASLRMVVQHSKGLAQAGAYSNDLSDQGLAQLVKQASEMVAVAETDPDAIPPSGADHPTTAQIRDWQQQHTVADALWPLADAREAAGQGEQTALDSDPRITNSEGATASSAIIEVAYGCADGFVTGYQQSRAGLSVSVIAGSGSGMQRDYAHHQATSVAGLRSAALLGQEAAHRACLRLGAKQVRGGTMTVLFEPRVATSLIGHLAGALGGRAVLQQRSYLEHAMGEAVLPAGVSLIDDPDHPLGLGNRLFDGEGSRCQRVALIEHGALNHWMCDRYAARRLGVTPLGHARRAMSGSITIGASNLLLQSDEQPPSQEAMIADIKQGILVHELMGFGVNGVTGDYSRGASGTLIEQGQLTVPVQEMTLAGNLRPMLAGAQLADDLQWFGSRAAPTVAIKAMQASGN